MKNGGEIAARFSARSKVRSTICCGTIGVRQPVRNVHGDYTEKLGPQRVHDLVEPDRVEQWLSGRFAIVNVWRPICRPVEKAPLAFLDGRSIRKDEFVVMDLVYPDRTGEIYGVTHNEGHQWFYFRQMNRREALLLKTYGSAEDGRVRFNARAAINDPAGPVDAPPHESIEVRALVRFAA